ncbi:hypothetical protein [Actinoalloteichus hymeniacidonis]|uniref:Uncharacterized protein n=1 Tax=Actinoalloteichus hymeniacidonis TaxID=340345 RepID=A0AAC9HSK7_9PSEU|nr:hypothetical protein [Actinoalloteichus hymeniacidonis]AOS64698.1 hypothetical protein TL08_19535 [Actinoalloteichus hymeniacidonis]MBB5907226.1 hypothetical protein [Actinoalloteichus hymeniacidonis]
MGSDDQTTPAVSRLLAEFDFDPRLRRPLAALGISPSTAVLLLDETGLKVRFGLWRLQTPLANLRSATVGGPFQLFKVAGVRLSAADRGLTFGTGPGPGVCIRFHRPVSAIEPFGIVRHPGLTVTVVDPAALADRVNRLHEPTSKRSAS